MRTTTRSLLFLRHPRTRTRTVLRIIGELEAALSTVLSLWVASLVTLALPEMATAQVLFGHYGANDPETEAGGWTADPLDLAMSATVGTGEVLGDAGIDPPGQTPEDAWKIDDNGGDHGFYKRELLTTEAFAARYLGWTLRARLRVVENVTGLPRRAVTVAFFDPVKGLYIFWVGGEEGDPEPLLQLGNVGGLVQGIGLGEIGDGYHTIEVVYDPEATGLPSGSAKVFVDDTKVENTYTGSGSTLKQEVDFGSLGASEQGEANYALVELDVHKAKTELWTFFGSADAAGTITFWVFPFPDENEPMPPTTSIEFTVPISFTDDGLSVAYTVKDAINDTDFLWRNGVICAVDAGPPEIPSWGTLRCNFPIRDNPNFLLGNPFPAMGGAPGINVVVGPGPPPEKVPTLSPWGLGVLAASLLAIAVRTWASLGKVRCTTNRAHGPSASPR
jgi:hypothetical protein